MWSFVGKKSVQVWVWLAMDVETRRIVTVWIGGHELEDAWAFRQKIPQWYLDHACVDTDRLHADKHIFNWRRHIAWNKGEGMTNHIERFNLTLRTRLAHLNRKSLCFSKSLVIHKAYILNFIHHYNEHLAPKLAA